MLRGGDGAAAAAAAAAAAKKGSHGARSLPPQTGEICLDILKTAWSPAWTLHSVCQAVMALMSDPAADSPLNCDAGACRGA